MNRMRQLAPVVWWLRCLLPMAAIASQPAVAAASCIAPPLEVLWSYPADGATDVPTNARLWVLTALTGSRLTVTLNGVALSDSSTVGVSGISLQPETLLPNTDYTLVLEDSGAGTMPNRVEISFKTGLLPATEAPPAPTVAGHSLTPGSFSMHPCMAEIGSQDCFDTGQNVLVSLDAQGGDETFGWLVSSTQSPTALWPARCGAPSVYVHPSTTPTCYAVQRIAAGGKLSEAVMHCAASDTGAAGMGGSAGAAGTGGTGSAAGSGGAGGTSFAAVGGAGASSAASSGTSGSAAGASGAATSTGAGGTETSLSGINDGTAGASANAGQHATPQPSAGSASPSAPVAASGCAAVSGKQSAPSSLGVITLLCAWLYRRRRRAVH